MDARPGLCMCAQLSVDVWTRYSEKAVLWLMPIRKMDDWKEDGKCTAVFAVSSELGQNISGRKGERHDSKKKISGLVWLQGRPGLSALAEETATRMDLSDGKVPEPLAVSMKRETGTFKKRIKQVIRNVLIGHIARTVEKDDKTCSRNGYVKIRIVL